MTSKAKIEVSRGEGQRFVFTRRMLYSLWWLAALIFLLSIAVLLRILIPAIEYRNKFIGDGKNPETYGFDLSNLTVERNCLVAAGVDKDEIPALVNPPSMPGSGVLKLNQTMMQREHTKFLVTTDRVIGITVNGESRAYPIRVLCWHEIANDTLGGAPIAVTYSPLCDSAAVFSRSIGGETLEFGVSGLLYNSNLVMFDRRGQGIPESLWSQLAARAISGPAAGGRDELAAFPCSVMLWKDWLLAHPDTSVVTGDPLAKEKYNANPYSGYFEKGDPRFFFSPRPPSGDIPLMERVIVIRAGGADATLFFSDVAKNIDANGVYSMELGGRTIRLGCRPGTDTGEPPTVYVDIGDIGKVDSVTYSFWFAWYAVWKGE